MAYNFNKNLMSLTEISHIRFQKILQMAQGVLVVSVLALVMGSLINKYSFPLNVNDPTIIIFLKSMFEILVVVIFIYYIRKFTMLIPFLFKYTKDYNPYHVSKDGESLIGKTIAFAVIFSTLITKTKKKLSYVSTKII